MEETIEVSRYLLNDLVTVEDNVLFLDRTAVFECNEDGLDMLRVMLDFTRYRKAFCLMDIVESLEIEQTEDNIFAIQNTINYLKGCFIIYEC